MPAADEDADFSAYAVQAWARLYRRAHLLSGQHADAEDLAQQTLIRARRHWRKVVRAGSPDAYVTRILTNVYLSSRQRAHVGREVLRAVPEVPAETGPSPIEGGGAMGREARSWSSVGVVERLGGVRRSLERGAPCRYENRSMAEEGTAANRARGH